MEEENRLQQRCGSSSETVGEKDLALAAKFKKGKKFKGKKPQKHGDHPNVKCFRCDQYGHYARDCKKPPIQGMRGKSQKKRFHASVVVEEEEEHPQQRKTRATTREERKECFLVSALSGSITNAEGIWLIDSGASRHMTRLGLHYQCQEEVPHQGGTW